MKLLSADGFMAILLALDIAAVGGGRQVTSREIASRHGLEKRRVEPVLRKLAAADLLKSARGPGGGYELAREQRRITLAQIVRAVTKARPKKPNVDSKLATSVITPLLDELSAKVMEGLDTLTLEQLRRQAQAGGVKSELSKNIDFSI